MRRLPVYLLVDVSVSMVGEPIQQVENGMRQIVQELRTDPYALETALISVLLFVNVETSCALTDRLQPVLGVERKALSAKLRKVVWT